MSRALTAASLCAAVVTFMLHSHESEAAPGAQTPLEIKPKPAPPADPEPYAEDRLVFNSLLAARLNPLGLVLRPNLQYRHRLFESGAPLFKEANIGVGFDPEISPAYAKVGGYIEVRPLTILLLQGGGYFRGWFGTFNQLLGFQSPNDDFSDTVMRDRGDADDSFSTTGFEGRFRAQLLAKVGPIVIRDDFQAITTYADMQGEGQLFYDQGFDVLMSNAGWTLNNDTDLVYLSDFGLVAGARATLTHAIYKDEHFQPGESTENNNTPHFRVGPLVAYQFYDDPEATINKPTVLAIVNWYTNHRFRTGQDVSQAVPYFVLGFRFEKDLWASNDDD